MNTLENKGKLFAQYWGQKVMKVSDDMPTYTIEMISREITGDVFLLLKPLSSISDKDAVKVAKMATYLHDKKDWKTTKIKNGRVYFKDNWQVGEYAYSDFFVKVNSFPLQGCFQEKKGKIIEQMHFQFPLHAYDYLRSKGYAIPWLNISVEQQIEFEWIKLIEE